MGYVYDGVYIVANNTEQDNIPIRLILADGSRYG